MITVNRRQLENFKRMIESDNLLLQSKLEKKSGNLVQAKILLKMSKKLSKICRDESLIFVAQNIFKN